MRRVHLCTIRRRSGSWCKSLILGDFDVAYVSTGKKQIGNPAGGGYRSGLGAFLFRTIGLEQCLYEPNVVVNRVAFLIFGLIPGEGRAWWIVLATSSSHAC